MVVYMLEQRWESGPAINLQKMPILAKQKNIFSDEAHFDLGVCVKTRTHTLKCRRSQNESLFLKISRIADVVWQPRRCDLTPLDYYLWSAVKDKCYANKPDTIDALKDTIRKAIREVGSMSAY